MDRIPSFLPPLPPPARAALLGFVTGLRSQVPVALLAIETRQGRFDPGVGRLARRFGSTEGVAGSLVGFAGELVADKLPITPRRTTMGPFLQRLATGATVGAAVHYDAGRSRPLGALLGVAGAGAGAWAGSTARTLAAERTRLPNPLLGAAEDLVAVGLAMAVVGAARDGG
ncbi:MAG TPA: hypothetical protein VG846_06070 [Actinomycetota bacterium]|nr:hypothetical protein [Actinomycetota bacterium]